MGLQQSVLSAQPTSCQPPPSSWGTLCGGQDLTQGGGSGSTAPVGQRGLGRRQGLVCRCLFSWPHLQVYNPRIRAESQVLRPISKSQAESRMQRAAGSPPGESPCPHVP